MIRSYRPSATAATTTAPPISPAPPTPHKDRLRLASTILAFVAGKLYNINGLDSQKRVERL